ncbi:MAG: universal stress protein [Anaerolineales bacterium]|nr:universal stress protein [Anaerolineales bacterium]
MARKSSRNYVEAVEDFRRARNQASLQGLLSRLTGESNQLLSYNKVRELLKVQGGLERRGVQDIPLDAIVGSVGRYTDFTRDFLPRHDVQQDRWARIHLAASGLAGLPPIEVYKIGEVYFVQDGNHRVSVARQMGAEYIQAYVTEVRTRVLLTPDITPDELILKAEYDQFLEQTHLDQLRPKADLSATVPGKYPILLEHIDVHRYFLGIDFQRYIPYDEAVTHWYDHIYLPIVEMTRERGMLRDFPNRTETDLYIWIADHRAELEAELGFSVRTEFILEHLLEDQKTNWISRLGGKLHDLVIPDELESGPPPGKWRGQLIQRNDERLFLDLLVPVNGKPDGWCALEQAIQIAQRESAEIHGLHVLPAEIPPEFNQTEFENEFNRRCTEAGVKGQLVFSAGDIVEQTCRRAPATDLVVVNLSYPPGNLSIERLSSGFRNLLSRCPRPVMATPQTVSELRRAVLAYDDSPKAHEALFVAAYLAQKWQTELHVLVVEDVQGTSKEALKHARGYLDRHDLKPAFILEKGQPAEVLMETVNQVGADFIIMGGYGLQPVLEVVLGSAVDSILQVSKVPTLICR